MGTVSRLAGRLATPREPECQSDNLSDSCPRQACRRPILEADPRRDPACRPSRTRSPYLAWQRDLRRGRGRISRSTGIPRQKPTFRRYPRGLRGEGGRYSPNPAPATTFRNPGLAPEFPLVSLLQYTPQIGEKARPRYQGIFRRHSRLNQRRSASAPRSADWPPDRPSPRVLEPRQRLSRMSSGAG